MEEQQKETKKSQKIFWIIFDILFFGIYFLLFLYLVYLCNTIFYYDGYYGTNRAIGLFFLIIPVTVPFIVVLSVRAVFWKKNPKSKKWLIPLALIGILCNPIVAMIISVSKDSGGYVEYTRGFHQRMKERLAVKPIREWIETLDNDLFQDDSRGINSSDELIPVEILDSIPLKVFFHEFIKTEQGFNCIRISTGSGGISRLCGVVIGPEEMPIPPTEEAIYDNDGDCIKLGELRIKLEDGA